MVSIKDAVRYAMAFAGENLDTSDFQLEEVESGKAADQEAWLITLSMPKPSPGLVFLNPRDRLYKVFAVLKSDGNVVSMKIRELEKG